MMIKKILSATCCLFILSFIFIPCIAQAKLPNAEQNHEQIRQLWNQKKAQYIQMIKRTKDNTGILYDIQGETNNLLKYAGYSRQYALLDELISLYLLSLDTLTETDQYLFSYFPGDSRVSVHRLNKKYRMWVDNQKPVGQETILDSAQFLYVLSEAVSIISDIEKEKRTPIMKEALSKFIPLLLEHYNRWIFNTPGPFQVAGWGCRYNGESVSAVMNHYEFLTKKLERKLGNGNSPSYCNVVQDIDMWIIAGVANILAVSKKEKELVNMTPQEYGKFLNYVRMGANLLESRITLTKLKNFDGRRVVGAIFDPGIFDEHPDYDHVGYTGPAFPDKISSNKLGYQGRGVGWDLSHARRFVHVFDALLKSGDILDLDFPTKAVMKQMANQLVYATFNRDFQKPLFTNFMDGTNGWYRVNYAGRPGFGYGPWDMSINVFDGGYGFWSVYNRDIKKVFSGFWDMMESNDPAMRKHVAEHYGKNYWNQHARVSGLNFENKNNPNTQSFLIQFMPSLYFMNR